MAPSTEGLTLGDVVVVVVSYNVRDKLRRCLTSLPTEATVVVVDNASNDSSADMVAREFPNVRLLASSSNNGFSTAVNRGAREAEGAALLLLNPDTELSPGTLAAMVARLNEAGDDVWALGFRQVDDSGFFQLAVGPPPWLWAEVGRMVLQRALDRRARWAAHLLERMLSRPRSVPWVGGSAMIVRREGFDRVGGFDEGFFLYFEDADFCLRLRMAGGRVLYDPRVTLVHHGGASAASVRELAETAYRRSQLRYWDKHRGAFSSWVIRLYQRLRGVVPSDSRSPQERA